jgi:hypothetical protein
MIATQAMSQEWDKEDIPEKRNVACHKESLEIYSVRILLGTSE